MTATPGHPRLPRRVLCLALAATLTGCTSNWIERKKLGPIELTRMLSIMVFKSDRVRELDEDRVSDAVAKALAAELSRHGIATDIVELAGPPQLPRIELAFWDIEDHPANIVVDCAFVSETDDIAFIGRVVGHGGEADHKICARNAAQAIAAELLGG
jgi:hypothetical protein